MMKLNPVFAADFYKVGHIFQIPSTQTKTYANFTARSNRLAPKTGSNGEQPNKIVVIGLSAFAQWFLVDTWNREFFNKPLEVVLKEYDYMMTGCIGPIDNTHIKKLHKYGKLPIKIKALQEGSMVGMKVPFMTITETHPDFAWLPEYLETVISTENWKVMTSATLAFEFKKMMTEFYDATGVPREAMMFSAHDFSFRGLNGAHDAAANGIGHLANFFGSDTIPAISYAREYYNGSVFAGSIPATEHSTSLANILYVENELLTKGVFGGKTKAEWDLEFYDEDIRALAEYITIKRLITEVYPSGLVGYVADSFDYFRVVSKIVPALKEVILARKPDQFGMAKLVIRPDSGVPVKIICGDKSAPVGTPEYKGTVECLYETFGGTTTHTGHIVLHERIGVIYGDSISFQSGREIYTKLMENGFAASNIVFGLGSYFYNGNITRDTFGMAIKATYAEHADGTQIAMFKDPKTDNGVKKSARGLLRVELENGEYVLYENQTPEQESQGELKVVFFEGEVKKENFDEIRTRLASYL